MEYPEKVDNRNGCATLWRYNEHLNCYALVWPDEEPELFKIIRRKTFTPEGQGSEYGPCLYTHAQAA